jgi:hypothetical protein
MVMSTDETKNEQSNVVEMIKPNVETLKGLMTPPEQPQEKTINVDELDTAYLVGLDTDGKFIFQIYGKNRGIVQLLGLEYHARAKVKSIYSDSQMIGDRLVHEVGKSTGLLHQKLDSLMTTINPKLPDNKIPG